MPEPWVIVGNGRSLGGFQKGKIDRRISRTGNCSTMGSGAIASGGSAMVVRGRDRPNLAVCTGFSTVAYSLGVRGRPSTGDRASVIISVRKISSGKSSGGGKALAGQAIAAIETAEAIALAIALKTRFFDPWSCSIPCHASNATEDNQPHLNPGQCACAPVPL